MNSNETSDSRDAPSLRWLAIGAIAGLLAATYGLLEQQDPDPPLTENAAARVNGRIISREHVERNLERSNPGNDEESGDTARIAVLQRMTEEELLVQRGVELGLVDSDTDVRAAIVQSLIASITAEADAANPSDAELALFLQEHEDRYTFANALSVDAWISEDESSAQQFAAKLRDGNAQGNSEKLQPVPGLPEGPLPIERLRMFLGPGITGSVSSMADGTVAVFVRQRRWYVVRVNGHQESVVPELTTVRSQVLLDYRRSLADARIRTYVDDLQRRSDIDIAGP
jgi:hypothetical protein